jgi:hypothetical protein
VTRARVRRTSARSEAGVLPLRCPSFDMRSPLFWLFIVNFCFLGGCRRTAQEEELARARAEAPAKPQPPREAPTQNRAEPPVADESATHRARLDPETVLELDESAYHTDLVFDGPDIVVTTASHSYRVRLDQPLIAHPIPKGARAVWGATSLVYWKDGTFFRASAKDPGVRLCSDPRAPAELAHQGDMPVWVSRDAEGGFSIRTCRKSASQELYQSANAITTLAAQKEKVFFVETQKDGAYRFKSLSTAQSANQSSSSPFRPGRTPSVLVPFQDELFYYAGLEGGVRAITSDLKLERTVHLGWICSPLAVAFGRIFCASVDGIGQMPLRPDGQNPPVWHSLKLRGPVTALAANETHVAWVSDSGKNHLTLETARIE